MLDKNLCVLSNHNPTPELPIASVWCDGLKLRDVIGAPTSHVETTSAWFPDISSSRNAPSVPPANSAFLCKARHVNKPDAGCDRGRHESMEIKYNLLNILWQHTKPMIVHKLHVQQNESYIQISVKGLSTQQPSYLDMSSGQFYASSRDHLPCGLVSGSFSLTRLIWFH